MWQQMVYASVLSLTAACDPTSLALGPAVPTAILEQHNIAVILIDVSEEAFRPIRCPEVEWDLEELIPAQAAVRQEVVLLQVGETATREVPNSRGEPLVLFDDVFVPHVGAFESKRRPLEARTAFIDRVVTACETLRVTDSSPVHTGIARSLEVLIARCAAGANRRECSDKLISVHSDLQEKRGNPTVERRIALAIKGAPLEKLPVPPLRTEGVRLKVCGVSRLIAHGPKEGLVPSGALAAAWGELLGPGAAAFDPVCRTKINPRRHQSLHPPGSSGANPLGSH